MRRTTTYACAIRFPSNQDRTHQVQELHTINICNRTQASNHPSNRGEQYASVSLDGWTGRVVDVYATILTCQVHLCVDILAIVSVYQGVVLLGRARVG